MFSAKHKTNEHFWITPPQMCTQINTPVHALHRICTRRWTLPHQTSSSPRQHPLWDEPTWVSVGCLGEKRWWENRRKHMALKTAGHESSQNNKKVYPKVMHFSWYIAGKLMVSYSSSSTEVFPLSGIHSEKGHGQQASDQFAKTKTWN